MSLQPVSGIKASKSCLFPPPLPGWPLGSLDAVHPPHYSFSLRPGKPSTHSPDSGPPAHHGGCQQDLGFSWGSCWNATFCSRTHRGLSSHQHSLSCWSNCEATASKLLDLLPFLSMEVLPFAPTPSHLPLVSAWRRTQDPGLPKSTGLRAAWPKFCCRAVRSQE